MKQSTKTLLLWTLLIVMFLAMWQFFTPSSPSPAPPPSPWGPSDYGVVIVAIVLAGAVLFGFRRLTGAGRAAGVATRLYSEALLNEDYDAAERAARSTPTWPRAHAMIRVYHLGYVAYAAGRFDVAAELLRPDDARRAILYGDDAANIVALTLARRAVVLAALDRDDDARADIAAARAIVKAQPHALALAAFAEIVILARRRDLPALRDKLAEGKSLGLVARERAVVHAIDALASSSGTTAYRRRMDDATREPPGGAFAAWADRLVPGVAPFLPPLPAKTEIAVADEPRDDDARARVASERDAAAPGHPRINWWGFAPVAALVGAVALGYAAPPSFHFATTIGSVVASAIVGLYLMWRRALRSAAIERRATDLDASGKPDEADAAICPLQVSSADTTIASVLRRRAVFALHGGDANEALARCDKALAHLRRAEAASLKSANNLAPTKTAIGSFGFKYHAALHQELTALRAITLAGLGRVGEARVELSLLAEPGVGTAFSVELYRLARAGDAAALADLADRAGRDVLSGPFEIALLEAGRAASGDASAARWLERSTRTAPAITRFLERVAPTLLSRANKARSKPVSDGSAALP